MSMYEQAASIIREAEVFIITAGAGMGVDSGLPDFRGEHGFWNAYPAYARLGLSFAQCANPMHFFSNPHFAWGFYGHRTNLYRETIPHAGFHIIRKWIEKKALIILWLHRMLMASFRRLGMVKTGCMKCMDQSTGCSARHAAPMKSGPTMDVL